jgi:hypothetical protein
MTFFGMFGSTLIGFIFFNTSIFITTRTNFQFIAAGFYGSLFFSLLEYESVREQIFGMVIMLLINLILFTGKFFSIAYLIRDVFYLGGLFLSLELYYQFIKRNPQLKYYLRCFALALFYGLINSVLISIVFLINAKAGFPPLDFIYARARDGNLIGIGIGLGIDFYWQNINQILSLLKIKIY